MARRARVVALVGIAAVLAAACTAPGRPDGIRSPSPTPTPPPVYSAELHLPRAPATVVPGTDAAELAIGMSTVLFASAPIAVVAPSDDPLAQLRAASVAVALGAPLLLDLAPDDAAPDAAEAGATGSDTAGSDAAGPDAAEAGATGSDTAGSETAGPDTPGQDGTDAELERLGVLAVITVGTVTVEVPDDVAVVPAPADDARLAELLDTPLVPRPVEPTGDIGETVAAVATLDREAPELLARPAVPDATAPTDTAPTGTDTSSTDTASTATTAAGPSASGEPTAEPGPASSGLPLTTLADAPDGALVLTTGDPTELAAVATARAAGIDVVTMTSGDPRVATADVQAIADRAPTTTIAISEAFGTSDALEWKVATAATGVELPGGGQTAFTGRRMVAMYGCPTFPGLGILGEQDIPSSISRVQGMAAGYQPLTTDLVVPAFEIIVTIASAGAGDDGNYSNELPVETFVPWVEAARDAGVYVVLDLQPGRTDFVTQAKLYEQLLLYPNVGLALDPEWRLAPDQVHLRQIGSVGVDEVNAVAAYLADLTRTNHLPQKVLILHQFMQRMIQGRERLDTSHPELAVLIHADGQGSQGAKNGTWQSLQEGAPAAVFWGWKNFIDEDLPMLTPEQTYQVQPMPNFVSYQ